MNFLILSPAPPPPVPGYLFFRGRKGVGGGQNFLVYCGRCVWIFCTQVLRDFFLYMNPLTNGGRPGSELQVTPAELPPIWALTGEDNRFQTGMHRLKIFRNPSVAPGTCLGGHLVTIRLLEHP